MKKWKRETAAERKERLAVDREAAEIRYRQASPLSADGEKLWAQFADAARSPLVLRPGCDPEMHGDVWIGMCGAPGLDELLARDYLRYCYDSLYTLSEAGWARIMALRSRTV